MGVPGRWFIPAFLVLASDTGAQGHLIQGVVVDSAGSAVPYANIIATGFGRRVAAGANAVQPNTIAGIEVYARSVTAPPKYQSLNGRCGVMLIWTKMMTRGGAEFAETSSQTAFLGDSTPPGDKGSLTYGAAAGPIAGILLR
jgi:hypothetical protein